MLHFFHYFFKYGLDIYGISCISSLIFIVSEPALVRIHLCRCRYICAVLYFHICYCSNDLVLGLRLTGFVLMIISSYINLLISQKMSRSTWWLEIGCRNISFDEVFISLKQLS